MKAAEALSEFVHAGLAGGADRPAIVQALKGAGWAEAEIDAALAQWADAPGLPPVPRPSAYVSAREALLYGLLFIALGVVSSHIVMLGFGIIEYLLPDPYETYPGDGGWLRWPIATLIAFLLAFVLSGDITLALLVGLACTLTQFLIGNVLDPMLLVPAMAGRSRCRR